jgi:hypothetical protein
MPRRKAIDPTERLEVMVPESELAWARLSLFSPIEGKVPFGEMSRFVTELIHERRTAERLDLTPYGFPRGFWVSGPREMISELKRRLS